MEFKKTVYIDKPKDYREAWHSSARLLGQVRSLFFLQAAATTPKNPEFSDYGDLANEIFYATTLGFELSQELDKRLFAVNEFAKLLRQDPPTPAEQRPKRARPQRKPTKPPALRVVKGKKD